ncbi:MAG: 4-deoxy-4-formamido-L-arabinose-phosphoundecaprenol deformylase [Candidatus Dadabacteria bacterium]|nr:MAG: 4-deoxy-4-formamido-L-arabinose-phosphoundecaprenol deformylase [Candidatus Dadabacteria bacterium]
MSIKGTTQAVNTGERRAGLRIDVDTYRGTLEGVPRLLEILDKYNIKASFFFSVGPDNMGRHLWRLIRPKFLSKMLRSRAASLYGWDILFKGTLWPGPEIGRKLAYIIHDTALAGHEIGFHAWDHHAWQMKIEQMPADEIKRQIKSGVNLLKEITGKYPVASASPGWRTTEKVLTEKEKFDFSYNSDCRGDRVFYPLVKGELLKTPQVPVTLPTYDEVIGANGVTEKNYNDFILSKIVPDNLNVYTIHAEVEGIACAQMFSDLIVKAQDRGIGFVPLSILIPPEGSIPAAEISLKTFPGREGTLAVQQNLIEQAA